MPYLIVLNEEALPTLYETEAEAGGEGERLAGVCEEEDGGRPSWFVVVVERVN